MRGSKKKNVSMAVFFAVAVAMIAVFAVIAISGAWFSDSAEGGDSAAVSFGTVAVSATPQNSTSVYSNNLLFTPAELMPNATDKTITRTLTITNSGDVSIFTKFSVSLAFVDNTPLNNMLTLTSAATSGSVWQKQGDFYVYAQNTTTAKALSATSGQNSVTVTLTFTLSSNFGNAYADKTLRATFDVRATQSGNQSTTISQIVW